LRTTESSPPGAAWRQSRNRMAAFMSEPSASF
jgi:hypothetical protein